LFFEQLINGITLGSIYAIVALGYTLVFGVLDIINMAHGEIFMFGAFIGMLLISHFEAPVLLALGGAVLVTAAMGFLLERLALRPLRGRRGASHLASLISTIGVSIILENLAHHVFGAGNKPFPTSFADTQFSIGSTTIYLVQIIILVIAILLMVGLSLWLSKAKTGKALRATAENLETASLLGINTGRIIVSTVMVASAMGGIAGVLVGMAFNYVNNQMGLAMGLKGLAIIILGGMGSVNGAMAGGLILGLAETFVVAYGDSGYRDAIAFAAIIVILLIRPQGIFGQALPEAKR
jgi:branched-chain amino acid transport system permease protein